MVQFKAVKLPQKPIPSYKAPVQLFMTSIYSMAEFAVRWFSHTQKINISLTAERAVEAREYGRFA